MENVDLWRDVGQPPKHLGLGDDYSIIKLLKSTEDILDSIYHVKPEEKKKIKSYQASRFICFAGLGDLKNSNEASSNWVQSSLGASVHGMVV